MPLPPARHPIEACRGFPAPLRPDVADPSAQTESIARWVKRSALDPPGPPLSGGRRRWWRLGRVGLDRSAAPALGVAAAGAMTGAPGRRAIRSPWLLWCILFIPQVSQFQL